MQIARARAGQWTGRVEARFLSALSATCNVKAARAEVGLAHSSAHAHRKRWRAFAAAWDAAVIEGYDRIEVALLERGCNLFSDPGEVATDPNNPIGPMTVDQAIQLLHMHKKIARGVGGQPGHKWRAPRRQLADVQASILRKIEAIERSENVSAEQRAADDASYAARRRQ